MQVTTETPKPPRRRVRCLECDWTGCRVQHGDFGECPECGAVVHPGPGVRGPSANGPSVEVRFSMPVHSLTAIDRRSKLSATARQAVLKAVRSALSRAPDK